MAQQPLEMILVRQLAGYLFVPVLVVDTTGTVVFSAAAPRPRAPLAAAPQ